MPLTRYTTLSPLLFLAASLQAVANDSPLELDDFSNGAELTSAGSELRRFALTPVMIQGIQRPDLGDVRIYDGGNRPVPGLIRKKQGPVPVSSRRLSSTPVRTGSNTPGYVLDRKADAAPVLNALHLEWKSGSAPNVLTVRVEHAADRKTWSSLVDSTAVVNFDFEGIRLEQNRIAINSAAERYIRLTFPGRIRMPALASVVAYETEREVVEPVWIRSGKLEPVARPYAGYRFRLHEGIRPVKMKLLFPRLNSILSGTLYEMENVNGKQQHRAVDRNFVSYNVTLNNQVTNSAPVDISRSRADEWFIATRESRNLEEDNLPAVLLGYPQYEVVFAADGEEPYTVVWGNPDAPEVPAEPLAHRIAQTTGSDGAIAAVRPGAVLNRAQLTALMESREFSLVRLLVWVFAAVALAALLFAGYRRFSGMR